MRCLRVLKLFSACVCAVLRVSVASICSVEVFVYWFCVVVPTGTFPLVSVSVGRGWDGCCACAGAFLVVGAE